MKDRFTHKTRISRGNISRSIRQEVYKRDGFTCQFCGVRKNLKELTIDHLVPITRGGHDEITNYITSCQKCNQRKANLSLEAFASTLSIKVEELPVHGDPIIDNKSLPLQIRMLRKRIFEKYRKEKIRLTGKTFQKKLEKTFRRKFWETIEGKRLESEFPSLPGHSRVMIPEIKTIANSEREFWLLVELSKSANTRNLIGTLLSTECDDIEGRFRSLAEKAREPALQKRMLQALQRFEVIVRKRGI